jgi:hypothetical protein
VLLENNIGSKKRRPLRATKDRRRAVLLRNARADGTRREIS